MGLSHGLRRLLAELLPARPRAAARASDDDPVREEKCPEALPLGAAALPSASPADEDYLILKREKDPLSLAAAGYWE